MEDSLKFREIAIRVLRKWRVFVLAAVVFAVVAGGIKLATGLQKLGDTAAVENAKVQYEKEMSIYDNAKKSLEGQINNYEAARRNAQEYVDNSLYMKLDAYNFALAQRTFFVDYTIPETEDTLSVPFAYAYCNFLNDNAMYETVISKLDLETTPRYLKEIVSLETGSDKARIVVLQVRYTDAETAERIAQEISDYLLSKNKTIAQQMGKHTLTVAASSVTMTMDLDIQAKQKSRYDEIEKFNTTITNLKNQQQDLRQPALSLLTTSSVIKKAVKSAVLGAVVGIVLVGVVVLLQVLLSHKVMDEGDLERRYKKKVLGTLHIEQNEKGA